VARSTEWRRVEPQAEVSGREELMKSIFIAAGAMLALTLSGCGGSDDVVGTGDPVAATSAASDSTTAPKAVTVQMTLARPGMDCLPKWFIGDTFDIEDESGTVIGAGQLTMNSALSSPSE